MNKSVEDRQKQLSSFWDNGPGPAGVMLPPTVGYMNHDMTRKQMPAYSLGLQLPSTLIRKGNGPGPVYQLPKGMTAKGQDLGRAFTMRPKTKVIGESAESLHHWDSCSSVPMVMVIPCEFSSFRNVHNDSWPSSLQSRNQCQPAKASGVLPGLANEASGEGVGVSWTDLSPPFLPRTQDPRQKCGR
jgi:hypothetical protein